MASFELKPQNRIHIQSSTDTIVWTHGREYVPPILEGRISLSQWQGTFDSVERQYQQLFDNFQGMKPWIYVPCLLCCILPSVIRINREWSDSWMELTQQENDNYRSARVQVSLAKEVQSLGTGSSRSVKNEIVGLRFDVADASAGGVPSSSNPNDSVGQLEKLNQLYQTGALTKQEFGEAKAKLLQKM